MTNIPDRAVILAGGMGTRLRPYTVAFPKPLVPVGQYPILEIIIRQLALCDFKRITLAVNHQAELIKAYFGDGGKWGVDIDYSLEDKPLSTMGPLKLIDDLPDHFLVMNGDILTNLNFREFADDHALADNIFTISSFNRDEKVDYGVLDSNSDKLLVGFREKPVISYLVSMGIYMLSKRVMEIIPEDTPYGFDDLMKELIALERNATIRVHDGSWLDIGRPSDYGAAIELFDSEPEAFLPQL